jgi:pimeloyl-ACP methyl ester carboxylesterase
MIGKPTTVTLFALSCISQFPFTGSPLVGVAKAQLTRSATVFHSQTRSPGSTVLLLHRERAAEAPPSISKAVVWIQCIPQAQTLGALCGYLSVPLDREHPDQSKIPIYFELYVHSNPGPAVSAIVPNPGGPGYSTTAQREIGLALLGQDLDVHDLLAIDDRGRGFSATIDCEELQHGTAKIPKAQSDCATQLGNAASRFGTGDIAQDIDDVRAALGYEKIDYFTGSYGGEDATAYATRFGEHLRSIMLDAPQGTPMLKPFSNEYYRARSIPREVRLDCLRSMSCSPDHPNPDAELDRLIQTIREHPLAGTAHDASGKLVPVHIDETTLLYMADNPVGQFVNTGELLAAGEALRKGDATPLLRLGAESIFPLVTDYGDPTYYSVGSEFATQCADAHEPWKWLPPIEERRHEFSDAISDLPLDYFAPFSKSSATSLLFSTVTQCLWWEIPTPSSPVAPPHAQYPNVPTLVLDGDMDTAVPLEEVSKVAALFPGSTFVPVAEAGHGTIFWTQCAANLAARFVETLQVEDASCTQTPETVWPAMGRFPLRAANARPAEIDPHGQNQIEVAERKVVTVAVAAATDALQRSIIGSGDGVGLRAGTFHTDYSDAGWTTALTGCAFANDVIVDGTIVWGADKSVVADLNVSGSGTAGGTLHVKGAWQAPGGVGNFRISGSLGGRQVAVLVPEA